MFVSSPSFPTHRACYAPLSHYSHSTFLPDRSTPPRSPIFPAHCHQCPSVTAPCTPSSSSTPFSYSLIAPPPCSLPSHGNYDVHNSLLASPYRLSALSHSLYDSTSPSPSNYLLCLTLLSPSPYSCNFSSPYYLIQLWASLATCPPPGSPSLFPPDRLFPPPPCRHNSFRHYVPSLSPPPALYEFLHFLIAPVTACLLALLSPHSSARSPFFTSAHPSFMLPYAFLHCHLPFSGAISCIPAHAERRPLPSRPLITLSHFPLLQLLAIPCNLPACTGTRTLIPSMCPRSLHLRLSLCPLSLSLLAFVIVFIGISRLLAIGYEG
jgi:hypothetical protein